MKKFSGSEEYVFKSIASLMGVWLQMTDTLQGRINMLDRGMQRYKTISTMMEKFVIELASTCDRAQMDRILHEIGQGRAYFRVHPMGKKEQEKAEEWTTASRYDLQVIFDAAGRSECTFCDKSRAEAEACPLRKAMRRYTYGDEGKDIDGCAYRGWDWQVED